MMDRSRNLFGLIGEPMKCKHGFTLDVYCPNCNGWADFNGLPPGARCVTRESYEAMSTPAPSADDNPLRQIFESLSMREVPPAQTRDQQSIDVLLRALDARDATIRRLTHERDMLTATLEHVAARLRRLVE